MALLIYGPKVRMCRMVKQQASTSKKNKQKNKNTLNLNLSILYGSTKRLSFENMNDEKIKVIA